jgi:hypothetical protein
LKAAGTRPEPRRVGPQGEGDEAGGDRHGRARAGAAADEGLVEHAAWRAVGAARAHQACRELVEIGLADQHRPRRDQALDDGGRAIGRIGERRAGGRGREASNVDVVLDRERDAGQRQGLSGGDAGVDGPGLRQHGLFGQAQNPDLGLDRVVGDDRRQSRLGDIDGAGAGAHRGGDRPDGQALDAHAAASRSGVTAMTGAPAAMACEGWA